MSETYKPKKITILGGGIASLTTAYELTSQPGWNNLYEITIYQTGWRLGGKCASGRNLKPHKPDHEPDYRIEEHGLHIFFGFYENAFSLLNQCYEELGGNGPFSTIEDAFKPHSLIVLEEYINQQWIDLPFDFPTNSLLPWEGGGKSSIWQHICTTIKFVLQTYTEINDRQSQSKNCLETLNQQISLGKEIIEFLLEESLIQVPSQLIQLLLQEPSHWGEWLENINNNLGKAVKDLDFNSEGMFLNLAYNFAQFLPQNTKTHKREQHQFILKLINRFTEHFSNYLDTDEENFEIQWRLTLIDLALANIQGLFVDGVLNYRCLDHLDEYNYKDWLRKHGARESSVNSAFVRVLYDLVYGFPEGNTNNPQLAAGTAIRILMTILFQYNGAIMWKMQAGMGDTVITPLYEVLKRRGVKFKFFHVVKELHLDEDQESIAEIAIARQVNLKHPQQEYQPLIPVKDLLCWPSEPLYDQIVDEEAKKLQDKEINLESYWTPWQDVETFKLTKGKDFDIVLLGIAIAALPSICQEILQAEKNPAHQKWHNMLNRVKTVTTQGGQLWLKSTLPQLGWKMSSPVLGAYVEPIDVYADMSDLLPRENWPSEHYPYNTAYFTGVIADPGIPPSSEYSFPAQEQIKGDEKAVNFLTNHIGHLWPNATLPNNPQGLNWDLLIDYQNRQGVERFKAQYWRININPTERYVLSVPQSTKYRLKTDESGFDNLYLAGDWINNGYNAGCVEATVMSGMQATRAILQQCFQIKYTKKIIGEWDNWI
ncbi:NAD(P)-binding protein [Anabaena cylindrica FACHB-243]|uniref:Amine oxidase n=1 Tax=Anabaena cylindrica (strain ATCC 27899 / PCC 7122) TaxID=272123 RepID=K9ZCD2_ANACC|nr:MULTISPECIES: NAD(P)-binding protein [Anabaena]AFZ56040.1 amine oxidase [Anabaena cylindrica PCC 7122]MBD2419631.1 NAD(P)-binding protein [Anabaena cylindrica FACHB-243]MBY5284303.1 NAD(P)-binding protein [Anabaena sp. CCAP 1446/1C]MBY5307483.1 NAD(P)-binding protein [Anabaena sp. CCAP 1446/1C]MCM2408257.1 NAD(P)-binding protein [Anabaena sp. CCAP 1446/1C]